MGLLSKREFLIFAAGFCAKAQDDVIFSTSVKVVNVLAAVRDKKGSFVRDLAKDDFSLVEQGRPQSIKYFARQSDLPLTLGLMVDTSMSQRKVIDAERGASFRFLDQILREKKDQVFIMQFDMSVAVRQPLTDSRTKLEAALSLVDTPTMDQLIAGGNSPGTILYDAVVNASTQIMNKQTGRKAMILLTDGVDTGSDTNLTAAIDAAQKADALVYAIYFSTEGSSGRGILQRLCRETGGAFYEMTKRQTFEQIFGQIEEELRSQYSIGYVSDQPVRISEFRKIQLTTPAKPLVVQARDRYWAQR